MASTALIHGAGPFVGLRVAITGGTSGLGLALVGELVGRGANVAFVARGAERVERVARQHGAHGIAGDVSRKEDIHPIALQITGELGGLDILINNASDLGPVPLALLGDTECEDLERALATNVVGPFRLTRALLGALSASAREGRGGVVVNVSSDAAVSAYPRWGAYGSAVVDGSSIWVASEYIAHVCNYTDWGGPFFAGGTGDNLLGTCGGASHGPGVRTALANWSTRISKITP